MRRIKFNSNVLNFSKVHLRIFGTACAQTWHQKSCEVTSLGVLRRNMGTKLIEMDDGTLVEVEVPDDEAQQIA